MASYFDNTGDPTFSARPLRCRIDCVLHMYVRDGKSDRASRYTSNYTMSNYWISTILLILFFSYQHRTVKNAMHAELYDVQ